MTEIILSNGKMVYLGYFDSVLEAAKVYDEYIIKHFGDFALTNKKLGLLN